MHIIGPSEGVGRWSKLQTDKTIQICVSKSHVILIPPDGKSKRFGRARKMN
jgi:hypothetical protein